MLPAKTKRFAEIKDEVTEFHPILMKLLPKMPDVIDVEYTQGQTEMGADFVIARQDTTFGSTDYIGVVAKVGAIVQNFSAVERQIDECSVPRTFRNGKEKIIVDEVWVVATGYVTKGAQEKIHEKFKTRKIKFIDGGRLEKLIDKYLPSFWNEVPLETAEYLSKLKTRIAQIDISVSLVSMSDGHPLYIEQDIYTLPPQEYKNKPTRLQKHSKKIDIISVIEKQKLILIESGMGGGKSKLIRKLIDHYTKPETYISTKLFPLALTYKEFTDDYDSDIDKLIKSRVTSNMEKELHEHTIFLLFIDGVDEKNLPIEDQFTILKNFSNQVHSRSNVKAVITSRYLKALDETSELQTQIERYELRPLSLNKTIAFITAICKQINITDRLIEDLKKSTLLHELPRTPLAAILLAKIINENSKDLPSNIPELYSKCVELMLGRWEIDKGLESHKEYETLDNVLQTLAKYLLDNELPYISIEEAKSFFRDYLKNRNLELEVDLLFQLLVERTEFMLIDLERQRITFKHRSFTEFFYAKGCIKNHDMHVDNRAFQLYWMNIFYFYLGLLKDAPGPLRELIDLEPESEGERWLKLFNMANFFMAAYLTPYEVIEDGITKVMKDAANLYADVAAGKSESQLAKLPRMHFLFVFQYLMRYSYSFGFFIRALEKAALEIDESALDKDLKAYALFFVNVAYIDSGAGESFDFLLKDHGGDLPLDLILAYKHESKDVKERTALMRKQDKRLKRILKHNKALDNAIDALYKNPLKEISKEAKKLTPKMDGGSHA